MGEDGQLHEETRTFGKVFEPLIHNTAITDGAVRLYAHMHWRYGCNKSNHEGQRSMAQFMGVTEVTIRNRIDELEADDWVVTIWRERRADGNYITNFYHVFESQETCRNFRQTYQPEEGSPHKMKPKPQARERKSRKGAGGNPTWDRRNSSFVDGQNLSLDKEDSGEPDSVKDSAPNGAGRAPSIPKSTNPTGLYKTKWYPIYTDIYDDPFHSTEDFVTTQAAGHYQDCQAIPGRVLMRDEQFAGREVIAVEPASQHGYKREACPRNGPAFAALYEAVKIHVFEDTTPHSGEASRIAIIAHWLNGTIERQKWHETVGFIDTTATSEDVMRFAHWYGEHETAHMPKVLHKFAEHWRRWRSQLRPISRSTPPSSSLVVPPKPLSAEVIAKIKREELGHV